MICLLLAGCAGENGAKEATASGPPASAAPATATSETGGVDGLLVDDEQVPIGGANVTAWLAVANFRADAVSSKEGTYSFSNLEPGRYQINVSAFGYDPVTTKVDVISGEVARVVSTLTRVYIPVAAPEVQVKKGFINCSISSITHESGYYSYNPCKDMPNEASVFPILVDKARNATEVILELVWTPGASGVGQNLQMWLCSDKEDVSNFANCIQFVGPNPYAVRTQGPSPLVLRRQDLPFKTVQKFEVDVGDGWFQGSNARPPVTFQQAFELYMTVCYGALCAPEYQARPPA